MSAEIKNVHEETLDPKDWDEIRHLGHKMIDDMLDYLQNIRQRPAWQPSPEDVRNHFKTPLPDKPENISDIYEEFKDFILPYPVGNIHPRFWGWVFGTGSAYGMLADMLASGMNSNALGGDQSPSYVENQVIEWCKQLIGYPSESSGVLVSGCTMANLVGLTVARNTNAGFDIRKEGLNNCPKPMVLYASSEIHSSNQISIELLGLGSDSLRKIPVNNNYEINTDLLRKQIINDKKNGMQPFCVIGTAGTVNTGAVDNLEEIAEICKEENLWFHIDGAFGIFAVLDEKFSKMQKGIQLADSVAFDLHKWMYMPYEIGCVLVKNENIHRNAFTYTPEYLEHTQRGLASKANWFSDYGVQLSRGFRSLKAWMCFKENGADKYRRLVSQNIQQAQYLSDLLDKENELQLLAPVPMNIVCYRYILDGYSNEQLNQINKELLIRIQESGIAAPSHTTLNGNFAIRVAITNHRSRREDFELLTRESIQIGREIVQDFPIK